jgi:hypothetical protein
MIRFIFRDPGAIAVAGIFAFAFMGAPIWAPWLASWAGW